jgi:hypothetical protein
MLMLINRDLISVFCYYFFSIMRDNKLSIVINKPVEEVFSYTLNPKNTHAWIDSIDEEVTSEWPPKVGTTYRNRASGNERWRHYKLTALEDNKSFTLEDTKGNYHVKYSFKLLKDNSTEFEYYEWTVNTGLESLFPMKHLEVLKSILENA